MSDLFDAKTLAYWSKRRISLPASLLEPIPNLEYWNYLDRPDVFAACVKSASHVFLTAVVLNLPLAFTYLPVIIGLMIPTTL